MLTGLRRFPAPLEGAVSQIINLPTHDGRSALATPRSTRTLPPGRREVVKTRYACTPLAAIIVLVPALSTAQPADDGYCEYVDGTAAATAAPLQAPELFAQFGHIEQPTFVPTPSGDASNLRLIGGARYSLTNLFTGSAIKSRAEADCRRHRALLVLRGAPAARALAARIRVYDDAQAEANRLLEQINLDVEARRATTPEATATRLRVEELRAAAARARTELAALPPQDHRQLDGLLNAYRSADADIEASEGRLRKLAAYDLSVRVGVDSYLDGANKGADYFAVLQLGVNLGALWLGGHNGRAANGRRRLVRSSAEWIGANATTDELRATRDAEEKRIVQVAALVADLGNQLDALAKLEGELNKRFRETIWFDWIEAKAELAYLQAHVEALRQLVAGDMR